MDKKMENPDLNLYRIIPSYVDMLGDESKGGDRRVQQVRNKENRPFIGIIVMNGDKKYCVPLTTVAGKSKLKGKGGIKRGAIDYSPIYIDGVVRAGVQFSRMIPVTDSVLRNLDMETHKHDTAKQKADKALRRAEYQWIQDNKDVIVNKARTLYNVYVSGQEFKRRKDCLNFSQLEKICEKYEKTHIPHHRQSK